jgi:hypothetical protein
LSILGTTKTLNKSSHFIPLLTTSSLTSDSRHQDHMAIYRAFVLFTLYIIIWNGILARAETGWPIQSNGLQSKIQWDHYSLIIDGQRPFIFSGEMHPFRLPVPELWRDILEKMKAMGMRAVSVYIHWGFHSQYPNVTDFESGAHDIERLFETARDIGILVIVRPGPYINAETSGGGLALWATNGRYGTIRANGTAWSSAWESYWNAITKLTAKYQLTNNGNGTALSIQIENEFPNQWKDVHNKVPNPVPINYMELLEAKALTNGITIPMTHNMPSVNGKSWSKDYDTVGAGGDVDLYGLDSYVYLSLSFTPSTTHVVYSLPVGPVSLVTAAHQIHRSLYSIIGIISRQFPQISRQCHQSFRAGLLTHGMGQKAVVRARQMKSSSTFIIVIILLSG